MSIHQKQPGFLSKAIIRNRYGEMKPMNFGVLQKGDSITIISVFLTVSWRRETVSLSFLYFSLCLAKGLMSLSCQ